MENNGFNTKRTALTRYVFFKHFKAESTSPIAGRYLQPLSRRIFVMQIILQNVPQYMFNAHSPEHTTP